MHCMNVGVSGWMWNYCKVLWVVIKTRRALYKYRPFNHFLTCVSSDSHLINVTGQFFLLEKCLKIQAFILKGCVDLHGLYCSLLSHRLLLLQVLSPGPCCKVNISLFGGNVQMLLQSFLTGPGPPTPHPQSSALWWWLSPLSVVPHASQAC